ncbi:MAG: methyltransferase domain-containing protein [Caldilineaceae bacterium]|nr:methyltransferase domain-containing protein [Caldilineaceae bacterium]
MIELFAVTNRGIEPISAAEMARLRGMKITQIAYRRVHAHFAGQLAELLALRTVDDLFIQLAEWQGIGPHRSTLALLEQFALDLGLWQAVKLRAEIRPLSDSPTFSVSANFVGKRNYTTGEIKLAFAKSIETITGWRYVEDDRAGDINLRLFIEHETALVGMRLATTPLHRRPYKQEHLPGSLKPSVAAALLFVAAVAPAQTVLDPCCGTGTILIEAALLGAGAKGGDNDAAAIAAAQSNAQAASIQIDVRLWDARALPLADGSVDRIVSNLPWGRQIEVESDLAQFYQDACAEMERVLAGDGRIVLLTNLPHLVSFSHLALEKQFEISLFGQQPAILVYHRQKKK